MKSVLYESHKSVNSLAKIRITYRNKDPLSLLQVKHGRSPPQEVDKVALDRWNSGSPQSIPRDEEQRPPPRTQQNRTAY